MATGSPPNRIPAEQQIPGLRDHLNRLVKLSHELVSDVHIPPGDDFAFMALAFLTKQVEHAGSILKLGQAVDTKLIARSMLEGVGYLLWAGLPTSPGEPTRQELWQYFYSVINWRVIQKALKAGEPVAPEQVRNAQDDINRYGKWYLKNPATGRDPYRKNWHGTNIAQMFKDIDKDVVARGYLQANVPGPGETLYRDLYGKYSEWHHWDVAGIARLLKPNDAGGIRYDSRHPEDAAEDLRTAFLCLVVTAHAVNEHCTRCRDNDLDAISTECREFLSSTS